MLWEFLDEVNLQEICLRKFKVLQSCPVQLKGRYRQACRVVLEALHVAVMEHDETRELRTWKLFSVLPFWLLLRRGSQGRVARDELLRRFNLFEEGHWTDSMQKQPKPPNICQRAKAACQKVRVGEVFESKAVSHRCRQETLHELQH